MTVDDLKKILRQAIRDKLRPEIDATYGDFKLIEDRLGRWKLCKTAKQKRDNFGSAVKELVDEVIKDFQFAMQMVGQFRQGADSLKLSKQEQFMEIEQLDENEQLDEKEQLDKGMDEIEDTEENKQLECQHKKNEQLRILFKKWRSNVVIEKECHEILDNIQIDLWKPMKKTVSEFKEEINDKGAVTVFQDKMKKLNRKTSWFGTLKKVAWAVALKLVKGVVVCFIVGLLATNPLLLGLFATVVPFMDSIADFFKALAKLIPVNWEDIFPQMKKSKNKEYGEFYENEKEETERSLQDRVKEFFLKPLQNLAYGFLLCKEFKLLAKYAAKKEIELVKEVKQKPLSLSKKQSKLSLATSKKWTKEIQLTFDLLRRAQKTYERTNAFEASYWAIEQMLAEKNGGAAIPKVEEMLIKALPYMDEDAAMTKIIKSARATSLFQTLVAKVNIRRVMSNCFIQIGTPLFKIQKETKSKHFLWPFGEKVVTYKVISDEE
jgi:hypothetical protein